MLSYLGTCAGVVLITVLGLCFWTRQRNRTLAPSWKFQESILRVRYALIRKGYELSYIHRTSSGYCIDLRCTSVDVAWFYFNPEKNSLAYRIEKLERVVEIENIDRVIEDIDHCLPVCNQVQRRNTIRLE